MFCCDERGLVEDERDRERAGHGERVLSGVRRPRERARGPRDTSRSPARSPPRRRSWARSRSAASTSPGGRRLIGRERVVLQQVDAERAEQEHRAPTRGGADRRDEMRTKPRGRSPAIALPVAPLAALRALHAERVEHDREREDDEQERELRTRVGERSAIAPMREEVEPRRSGLDGRDDREQRPREQRVGERLGHHDRGDDCPRHPDAEQPGQQRERPARARSGARAGRPGTECWRRAAR